MVPILTGGKFRLELLKEAEKVVDRWLTWSQGERNKCGFYNIQVDATDHDFAFVSIVLEMMREKGYTEIQHSSAPIGHSNGLIRLIVTFSCVVPPEPTAVQ